MTADTKAQGDLPELPTAAYSLDLNDGHPVVAYSPGQMIAFAREAQRAALRGTQEGEPINLAIIRKWPDGFEARLQHVWLDVVSFIPSVKLYDLQRTLAEFGFVMEVRATLAQALKGRQG